MRDGVDDDVASRPGRLHMGRPIIQETVQRDQIGRRGFPIRTRTSPIPPYKGGGRPACQRKHGKSAHCSQKSTTLHTVLKKIVTLKKASHSTLHTSKKAPKFVSYLNCFMQNSSDLSSLILCVVDFHVRMAILAKIFL